MSSKLSVEEVLSNLETRAAFHRELEAFHAAQEVHHRKPSARSPRRRWSSPGRLISIAVNDLRLPEPFGPKSVAAEINRRFAAHLKKPIDTRTASDVLRHLRAAGEIELARKGKAVHEALYQRKPRPAGA